MSLFICGHHRYWDTPNIASWPGCPRCIRFRTACLSCTGTANRLFTKMQSSCTAICDHNRFVYGPINSKPCLSPLSITRLRRSIQVSSVVNSANSLLSNSFAKLSRVSSCCCFSSFNFPNVFGGSITHTSSSLSASSVFVKSFSITCTSLSFLSADAVGLIIAELCPFSGLSLISSVFATNSLLVFPRMLPSPPISCQNESSLWSASLCWSGSSCHFTRDACRVSLSELSLFFRPPLICFLVRCTVSVISSSSESLFAFNLERFQFGSSRLSFRSSFRQSCGVSDHQSYDLFPDISFLESVFLFFRFFYTDFSVIFNLFEHDCLLSWVDKKVIGLCWTAVFSCFCSRGNCFLSFRSSFVRFWPFWLQSNH